MKGTLEFSSLCNSVTGFPSIYPFTTRKCSKNQSKNLISLSICMNITITRHVFAKNRVFPGSGDFFTPWLHPGILETSWSIQSIIQDLINRTNLEFQCRFESSSISYRDHENVWVRETFDWWWKRSTIRSVQCSRSEWSQNTGAECTFRDKFSDLGNDHSRVRIARYVEGNFAEVRVFDHPLPTQEKETNKLGHGGRLLRYNE